MLGITSLFDDYGLRARLLPTLLVVLPAAAVVALVFPNIYATYARIFGSLGLVAVTLFFLAHVIRANGRALEKRLYAAWGGISTTAWLRHRDSRLDPITKARYHSFLESHVPHLKMPSADEEARDPEKADHAYASAVKRLLEDTRDTKKYKLIFDENVYYGFRRNTLAAKPIALSLLLLEIVLVASVAYGRHGFNFEDFDADTVAALFVAVVSSALWLLLVTKAWVQDGADAYARALLASCEQG